MRAISAENTDVGALLGEPKQVRVTLSSGEVCDFAGYVDNISFESPGPALDGMAVDYGRINMTIRQTEAITMTKPGKSIPWSMREDWNDTSKWLTHDSGMAPRLRRKNGKTLMGAEMMLACLPGSVVRSAGWFQPFAYGLGFLLLLWGCMAWEKWIGWVMR